MKSKLKTLLIWGIILGVLVALIYSNSSAKPSYSVDYDQFRRNVDLGRVAEVWVDGNQITVQPLSASERYSTLGVLDASLEQKLSNNGVAVHRSKQSEQSHSPLFWLLCIAGALALFVYLRRKAQGGMGDWFTFRKSRARLVADAGKATFADVGGCDEAKQLLQDVINFLRNPKRWVEAGARLPRGVLLEGPPGCGKTLLARAVAGETNSRFYTVSASEFVEMFVGVGAARVRDMFETAAKNAPAVVFVDELDAVGRRRGSGIGSANDEREQTLNQLLACLDGFHANDRVVIIAATNRPDILDQALLRPGRFDRRIQVPTLSFKARLEVLRIHTRNKNLASEVSLEDLAARTEGFNGAQLENLANEAALLAVRRACASDGQSGVIRCEDIQRAIQAKTAQSRRFDKLDVVLVESAAQLAEPTGKARARLALSDGTEIEGEVVWVDAKFIKMRGGTGGSDVIVAKDQVTRLEALSGTEVADPEDINAAARPIPTAELA